MAVDLGDHCSGFRHSEVIKFINSEILMNGGGPEFYMAFSMWPWNDIEDQLHAILIDPQVPHTLKRACTWSALALSVRVAARQREQQAYMAGLLQESMGPYAPRVSISELWQLRQQREEAVSQLLSTQAALQQALRECDHLRQRLHHAERVAQMAPLVQDLVAGAQVQQLGAAVVPLNPDHSRAMGAVGRYNRQYLEAQLSAATNVFYVPGSTSPWPLAMQPSLPVALPCQFPPHAPFIMGSPYLVPFSPPLVREAEASVVVPVQVPPVYPSGPFAASGFQDPAGLWDQRCYTTAAGPPVIRDCSQEGASGKPQTDTLGDIRSYIQGQGPKGIQVKATLPNIRNYREDKEENEGAAATFAVVQTTAVEETTVAVAVDDAAEETDDVEEEEEDEDDNEEEAYDNSVDPQYLQELYFPEKSERYSQSEKSPQASALVSLVSSGSRIKGKGVEEAQTTPIWESWSQAVRESPKKKQPQLLKEEKKPQVEAASEYQPVSRYGLNWGCPRCKAVNFSWRKVCYKCKKIYMVSEYGGQTQ
ncbi:testis-expressed protein 13D-like [Meriones unguiculatus]|uniref:testis-expressed protein 13D-like n=1 Tax=Meriones unguiculatus TaxID=10047 RepID=UPI00293EE057|nr:testis-expressed protein 13D-like [Meriones unguiculatus]